MNNDHETSISEVIWPVQMFLFGEIIEKASKPPKSNRFFGEFGQPFHSEWVNDLVNANNWICAIDESYLSDDFNLYGLSNQFKDYTDGLKIIKGTYYGLDSPSGPLLKQVKELYELIHARFLLTHNGAQKVKRKYEKKVYGVCPRVACNEQPLLPIGLSPTPGDMNAKTFCPCCQDIYETNVVIDGAFFGPYFPHFFLQALKEEVSLKDRKISPMSFLGVPLEMESKMNRSSLVHNPDDLELDEDYEL